METPEGGMLPSKTACFGQQSCLHCFASEPSAGIFLLLFACTVFLFLFSCTTTSLRWIQNVRSGPNTKSQAPGTIQRLSGGDLSRAGRVVKNKEHPLSVTFSPLRSGFEPSYGLVRPEGLLRKTGSAICSCDCSH